jgi:hypothetical protein
MRRAALLTSAAALLSVLVGCGRALSREECDQLLDRYVELLVRSDLPDTKPEQVLQMQREARQKARRDPAFSRCKDEVSRSAFECAMHAENADRLEQCLL